MAVYDISYLLALILLVLTFSTIQDGELIIHETPTFYLMTRCMYQVFCVQEK